MDRHGPKTKEDFKDSLVFQRDLAEMLGQEVKALQARVKETEHTMELHRENYLTLAAQSDKVAAENARLRKLVDMNRKVVDACRKNTHRSPEITEALRELDGEKKSSPGCTCQEWSGALCGHCQKVHKI